jgi:hypothetical protein
MLLIGSPGIPNQLSYFSVLPKSMTTLIDDKNFKPSNEEERVKLIKVKEIKKNTYKQLVKRLAFEELKKITGGFDFSRTIINPSFFENIKP